MPDLVPLVGRTSTLTAFAERLNDNPLPSMVVTGPAGIGKTRFVAEAERLATEQNMPVAHVAATKAAASIPFGPFAALLPDADLTTSGLLGLLRSVGDTIVDQIGMGRSLLLVVDDADLLDDASAALVHQLAGRDEVCVIVTVSTPGMPPDPITALWKDGLAGRIDLGPLSEDDVDGFAAGILEGPIAGASIRMLSRLSGGNPLYLRELIRSAADSGDLTLHDGIWILRRQPTAPPRLAELLGARLADLSTEVVGVIDRLALAGSLGYPLLERLTSVVAVEEAERRGLIQVRTEGRRYDVTLTHPMYGEVRRLSLLRAQQQRLHGELADVVDETGGRRRDDLLRLASWRLDAGRSTEPELLTRAAKRARAMYDMDLAARLAAASFEAGGGVDAGLVLAVTHFATGAHTEADRLLAELTDRCSNDDERAAIANARAYNRSILLGDPAGALAILDAAMLSITDPTPRLTLSARAASISLFAGQPAAALEAVQPALHSDDDEVASSGHYVASTSLALLGRNTEAVDTARRGLTIHQRCLEPTQIPEVQLIGAVLGLFGAGSLPAAESAALSAYNACLEAGDREGMATFSLLLGNVRVDQGLLAGAALAFREGAAINRELSDTGALRWCVAGVALAEGMSGDDRAASEAIAELDELRPDWMAIFAASLVSRGRAWAQVASHHLSDARQTLRSAAQEAKDQGQLIAEAHLRHDLARLGEARSVRPRLLELRRAVDGALVAAFAEHTTAISHNSGAELEGVAAKFAELGAYQLATEAAIAAAAAYLESGRRRQASAATRLAAIYAEPTGATSPTLPDALVVDPLTDREREIAVLAASGSSSKVIAAQLVISLRTVDNHLQRIYTKLGINGRDQLKAVL